MKARGRGRAHLDPDTARRLWERGQSDPIWFIRNVLGGSPWRIQEEIIRSCQTNRETCVASCHGSGKSWIAARIALWFLFTHPRSYVVTTAPTFHQVRDILWQEIGMAHRSSRVPLGGELLETRLKIEPGWFAVGISTYHSDAFQGRHAAGGDILIIADEAAGVEEQIWIGIDGLMSSRGARLLAIGNPTSASGRFYQMFKQTGVAKFHISAFDTPNFTGPGITIDDIRSGEWRDKLEAYGDLPVPGLVTPEWVAERLERWGEDSPLWISRVQGDFPEEGDDTVIPLAWVEKSMQRWKESQPAPAAPAVVGMDVARFGSDRSCIAVRRGRRIERLQVYAKRDLMELAGLVVDAMRREGAQRAFIDEVGMGSGVVDRLREQGLGHAVRGINTGERARDPERFANLRAELWWNLRELLNPDTRANPDPLQLPPDDELLADLTAPRYRYTSRGQIQIESKDEMRRRGVRSTDLADAVCLCLVGAFREKGRGVAVVPRVVGFGDDLLEEANRALRL
ncbi:MAG TPA: hypothetical protein PK659_09480 [Methanothrix sp.]|nr:hypothetical protein [Methanothrix sp.]HOL44470.1 hypothetical protein [Methanothrix sp.]